MSSFENLRVVDNFYQTSLFFPMPTVVISTLCEDGSTSLGPYSFILESTADKQKSDQKKIRPDMVAKEGLYKIVRCPNYLGEILFWTGIFVSGWDILTGAGQWIMAIIAYICIVYIMFNGAQRLEKRQMKRYGADKEYNDYADKTSIIIPLLPIYNLNNKSK